MVAVSEENVIMTFGQEISICCCRTANNLMRRIISNLAVTSVTRLGEITPL